MKTMQDKLRSVDWNGDHTLDLSQLIVTVFPMSDETAAKIIEAPVYIDGRSEFKWVCTLDGSWMLACFPQGDLYFETELDREHGFLESQKEK